MNCAINFIASFTRFVKLSFILPVAYSLMLWGLPLQSSANELVMCSAQFNGFTNKDGSGYYWEILRTIFHQHNIRLSYQIVPFNRCLILLEQGNVDGIAALFKTPKRMETFQYPKSRIHFASYGLFYLKENTYTGLSKLNGRVGKIRGYDFSSWLPKEMKFEPLVSASQAIKMLNAKHIKFYAENEHGFYTALNAFPHKLKSDYNKKIFLTKDVYSAFSKSKRGLKLANIYDQGIKKLALSQTLEDIAHTYDVTDNIIKDYKRP